MGVMFLKTTVTFSDNERDRELVRKIDKFKENEKISRIEAVRRLLDIALAVKNVMNGKEK